MKVEWSRPELISREDELVGFAYLLYDRPKASLDEVLRFEARLHELAALASDLGLDATWMRLECVDDEIDKMIVALREPKP